nr:tetraspanin-4 isoform X3 [Manis javanica]
MGWEATGSSVAVPVPARVHAPNKRVPLGALHPAIWTLLRPRWPCPSLGGCGILGVGVWLATTQGSFATLSSSFPSLSAANLLIVTGTFVMAIGFVGCIGAIKENKCLLLTGDMEFGAWCLQGAIWDPSAWPRLRGDCMGTPGEDRPASLAPSPHPHPGALWGRVGASWTVPCSPAPVLSALLPRAVTWR